LKFNSKTKPITKYLSFLVVMVLPDPFRGMGAWRNSTEIQQSGHTQRSEPEVENGRNTLKDSAPGCRFRCGIIQEQHFTTSTWWCGHRPLARGGSK